MNNFDEFLLKRFKVIITILVILFLIALAVFVYTLSNLKQKTDIVSADNKEVTISPIITEEVLVSGTDKEEVELNIGKKDSNTTEVIEIKAKKITEKDMVAIIRLRIEGGEIVNKSSPYIMLEGCNLSNSGKMTNVCVDVASQTPFIDGETILSITIKWDSSSIHQIFRSSENGYYNGIEFNASTK